MDYRVIFVRVDTVAPLELHWKCHVSLAHTAVLLVQPTVSHAQPAQCVLPLAHRSLPHVPWVSAEVLKLLWWIMSN